MKNRELLTNQSIGDAELTKLQRASSALTGEFHTAVMLSIQCGLKSHHVRTIHRRQIVLDDARLWCGSFGCKADAERPPLDANEEPRRADQ